MKIKTFRIRVAQADDNLGFNPDGSIIESKNKAMLIVDLETANGQTLSHATEVFDTTSKESRRNAIGMTIGAISALLISECFPEDTPRYKLSYEPGSGFKHEFEGMPEDLCHA